ncbi:PC-Esterase protein [Dioscorea alata]|uniref:PC-Esterase protein n=1 Tax=Dioscorea alata TaxID=55571 RepID=A0ACB7UCY7_DIOAL|nr:PC-Esterase protein [Dioscorea alata]
MAGVGALMVDWDRWPLHQKRGNHAFVKLFLFVFLLGFSFRVIFFYFFSDSFASLPLSQPADVKDGKESLRDSQPLEGGVALEHRVEDSQKDTCDLFKGEWISNPSGPAYTNESCLFIESPQNCMKNGRPDTGYLYWRWKPYGCEVPQFDAKKFLDVMKDKSWAMIGDSIFRNHVQSLICLLVKVEVPIEVYHDKMFRSRRWHFSAHNFTLSVIWSPFLVKAENFGPENGASSSIIDLHLDILDEKWISQYQNFNYILISGGPWFLRPAIYWENNKIIGCHSCQDNNLSEISMEYSFRKALQLVFNFFAVSDHKPFILYRTYPAAHFENAEWNRGGTCNRTVPYKEGEFMGTDLEHLMRNVELEEFKNAVVNVARLKLLDTYKLSLLRPDGHSGPYRTFHPFDSKNNSVTIQNDCLHWCLPGPIDSWNELVMELVLNRS